MSITTYPGCPCCGGVSCCFGADTYPIEFDIHEPFGIGDAHVTGFLSGHVDDCYDLTDGAGHPYVEVYGGTYHLFFFICCIDGVWTMGTSLSNASDGSNVAGAELGGCPVTVICDPFCFESAPDCSSDAGVIISNVIIGCSSGPVFDNRYNTIWYPTVL